MQRKETLKKKVEFTKFISAPDGSAAASAVPTWPLAPVIKILVGRIG